MCRNAFTAIVAAPRNFPRLNFIIVTRNVPPSTTSSDGVLTKVLAEPPRRIDVSTIANAPIKPIRVARSKDFVSVHHNARR